MVHPGTRSDSDAGARSENWYRLPCLSVSASTVVTMSQSGLSPPTFQARHFVAAMKRESTGTGRGKGGKRCDGEKRGNECLGFHIASS